MRRSALSALPLAAGCCPHSATFAEPTVYVATDLGVDIDDAGCAVLCTAFVEPNYAVTGNIESCHASLLDGGVAQVTCGFPVSTCVGGRRPPGFEGVALLSVGTMTAVGEWLARAAALEAASVSAFNILAMELSAHGAPSSLVSEARRSADQEKRHAKVMARLARRYDAFAIPVARAIPSIRRVAEIAVENTVEGGIRETFGTMLAEQQARTAADPEVRNAFRLIAREEAAHARLSAAVAKWISPKLSAREQRRLDEARQRALAEVRTDAAREIAEDARDILGLPEATRALDLIDTIEAAS